MRLDAQSWLALFSFSLFIVAAVLLWQAYKVSRASPAAHRGQIALYAVAAALAIVLGLAGVRARHRRED